FNVDGNSGIVNFRARTYSDSCGFSVPSPFGEILHTIYVEAEYQLNSNGDTIYNAGDISWNRLFVDTLYPYTFERKFKNTIDFNLFYRGPQNYSLDPGGTAYCDDTLNYRVRIQDTSGCMNISSVDVI